MLGNKLRQAISVLSKVLLYVSCSFTGLITLLTGIDMIGRKLPVGSLIAGSYELVALMLFVVFLTAFPHTEAVNRHIEVEIVTDMLPKGVRDTILAVMLLTVVIFSAFTAWSLVQFGIFLTASGKVIQTYPILTGPFYIFGGICWVMYTLLILGRLLIIVGGAARP